MNLFEAVKQNVTTRQAAERYGIRIRRNGMAVCPFHNDKNPSMKLDRRFHCFGCQADGDAVDFVSRLFGLPSKEAAMKIADDFGISYDSRQKPSIRPKIREPTPEQKYQQEENHCYKVLSDYFHLLRKWEKQYAPQRTDEVWHPLFVEALEKKSYIEYLLDILLYDTPEEKKALVAEQRKEVMKLEQRIAGHTAEQTVEEVRGSLDLTDNGAIKNSIRNCLTVFQNDPVLQGAVRYNILTERIDIVKPLWWSKQTATLTDTDLNYLMLYLEDKYSLTSEKKIQKALSIIADSNKYHPIRDYLNGLEWDGTERIRYALPRFLGAEEGEYTYQALRLFMLGAISRVFKPGCKFEVMLCLVGGQGAGKSTFFRLLAVKDEWFSDDLKKIDDDNVYRKMQGHWIIEMSEMIATANAKSIEDIKSFISRAKETYKVPYETHPADRLRQCVFGGSSNTMDFLPLDRSGNRRFLPIMVHPENAEIHILEDEAASRAFIDMMWAEVMFIYQNFPVKLTLSKDMDKELKELQKQFMPEDTKAGLIQSFLDNFKGTQVCSKLIYAEALNHPFDEPKQWEIREINEIMNNSIEGWRPFSNPRSFAKYGRQRGWERIPPPDNEPSATGSNLTDGFRELTEEEARQMELPF